MKRAKIIIGLQVAFLVGILAFSGILVYHSKDRPTPVTTLKAQLGLQVDTDPAAYEKFKDKRGLAAQVATMVRDLQAGKTPEGIRSLGKVDDQDAFGATLEGTNLVILPGAQITELKDIAAAIELANAQVGILRGDFSKASSAGKLVMPVPDIAKLKPAVTLTPAEAMKLTTLQSRAEAVVVAPPVPGQIPPLFAMVTKSLGEELGPRLVTPTEVESWEEALGALEFKPAVRQAGKEVTKAEAVPVTLGEFAAQFAEPAAIEGHEGVVTTIAYPGIYVTEEVMEFAAKEKIIYGLKAILPGRVGHEFIKTPGVYITSPVVIRPLNMPVIVSIQRHITKEGEAYLMPEAEELALISVENVEKALLETPVGVSIEVLVRPGQPFVIPAGVGYSVKNPTPQPAFLEYLVSTEQRYISGPYQRFGEAHYIRIAEGMKAITIEANPAYETELPKPTWATPTNIRVAGLETEGPSLYTLLAGRGLEAGKLAAFLRQGKLQPSEAAEGGYLPEIYEAGGGISFLVERGKPAVQETSLAVTEQILGLPVTVKAASAGYYQIGPADIKKITQLSAKEEVIGTLEWDYIKLQQKYEEIKPAGVNLAEAPAEIAEAKQRIEKLLFEELKPPSIPLGEMKTEEETVQALSEGREAVTVPVSAKEFIVMEQRAGTYQPVMAEKEVSAITKQAKIERGAILIDLRALGIIGTRKDGSEVFVPNDFVMKAIAILNNLKDAKMEDGVTPRYHVAVYSDNISEQNMKNLLGALAVPFDNFIQAPTVAEAIGQIAEKEKIKQERFIVNIAQSTIDRNPKVLDGFAKLAEAVNLVMVKTPKPGEYVSYKATLFNSLRLLEGILTPQQITDLKVEIENAPTIRGLTVEPEEDKDKAVSRMQAAVSV